MSFPSDSRAADPPRRRWWRSWLVRLFLLVLVCVCLVVGSYAYRHYRAVQQLEAAVAELDRTDPGWHLQDIEAARAVVPDAENSAPVVTTAFAALPRNWPPQPLNERLTNLPPPQMQLGDEDIATLREELTARNDALQIACKVADLPRGRHPITYKRNFIETLLPHVQQPRSLLFLLHMDVLARAQDGDLKGALRSCRALLNAARSLGDEPLLISQLVRMAGVGVATTAVQRVLAQGEPDADDLLDLQKLLEDEERFPRLLVGSRGERGGMHEMLDAIECGEMSLAELGGGKPSWADSVTAFTERDYIRAQHPDFLALETEMIRIAALPASERSAPLATLDAKFKSQPPGIVRLLLPAFLKIAADAQRTDSRLRCLIAALAAERYRRAHGRFPDTLEQLVPDFLAAVPLDPQDGQPLRYQRRDDRVVIYSHCLAPAAGVGPVAYDPDEPSPTGVGVAVHLFDVKHRRQPFAEIVPPPARDDDDVP